MKKFKQFYTEAQSKHDELFLILSGDIKINRTNACKIWDKCGKRDTFRHITSLDGLRFLLNNKNPKMAISAMKFGKRMKGIETEGDVIAVVEGDYEIWFPEDAYSFIDRSGTRWIRIDMYDTRYRVLGDEFFYDYMNGLKKLIDKYRIPKTLKDKYGIEYDIVDGKVITFGFNFEDKIKEFETDNQKKMDKFQKQVLDLQVKLLDKYSDKINENLIDAWIQSRTDYDRRQSYIKGYDEAIISNVKVKEIIYTHDGYRFSKFLNEIQAKIQKELEWVKELKSSGVDAPDDYVSHELEGFIENLEYSIPPSMEEMLNSNIKIPFTYLEQQHFGTMLKAMKKTPLAMKFIKEHYGLIQKGHFLVRK